MQQFLFLFLLRIPVPPMLVSLIPGPVIFFFDALGSSTEIHSPQISRTILVQWSLVHQFLVHCFLGLQIHVSRILQTALSGSTSPLILGSHVHDPLTPVSVFPGPQIFSPLVSCSMIHLSLVHWDLVQRSLFNQPYSWSTDPYSTKRLVADLWTSDHCSTDPCSRLSPAYLSIVHISGPLIPGSSLAI